MIEVQDFPAHNFNVGHEEADDECTHGKLKPSKTAM
jgi:hypothetical protein